MQQAKHIRPSIKGRKRHRVLVGVLAVLGGLLAIMGIVCAVWLQNLPSLNTITDYQNSQTTTVYANDNTTVLAEFYLEDRQPVNLDQIAPAVLSATLDTEDARFYDHGGVDPIGIARALVNNIMHPDNKQGASTITQQLVRNTVLSDEAFDITLKRKVREAVLAMQLEGTLSKDQILNLYLNTINYGDNCYGIEAAAQHYFSKKAADLTVLEAATLAGIPQSPTAYTPTVHPDACKTRRNQVLQRMAENGDLSQSQADALAAEPVTLQVPADDNSSDGIYQYPYFTSYVRDTLLNSLGVKGVYEGGLTVYTTLDPALQADAEAACQAQYDQWDASTDAEIALVSIDPDTGFIKALVGGKDYASDQFNLVTQASRQAGSAFKAFTLTAAIQDGINPATLIDCTSPATLGTWKVENINNVNYGIRSIQSALAVSSNTGFARLCEAVGPQRVVDTAQSMGITSELSAVPSITLGSSGVSPLEMCAAYATFADGGIQRSPTAVTKVVDRSGATVYEWQDEGTQALSSEVCYAATRCLQTVFTQGTAVSAQLYSGQVAAGKTGTSENYRDHWLCGYTPQLSTTVWMGSRQEQSLPNLDCCYVWRTYMTAALNGQELEQFPTAANPPYDNAFNSTQAQKYGTGGWGWGSSSSSAAGSASSSSQGSASSSTTDKNAYQYQDEQGNVYAYDEATDTYAYSDGNGGTYRYNENTNTYSYESSTTTTATASTSSKTP